jgi:Flp pilus assembly protein TadD
MNAPNAESQDHFAQGVAALGRADYAAAKAALQRHVELAPNDAEGWCYLGMALTFGESLLAGPALDRALSLNPRHHGALYWRAEVHWIQGEPRAAAERLRQLNELVPDVPHNLARMGYAYLSAGDADAAKAALNAAVDAGGGLASVEARRTDLRKAFYLDALGRHEEARRLVQRVNSLGLISQHSAQRYPRDLEDQRCALENLVAGRDLVVLGSGPSLGQLEPLLAELGPGGCEDLRFFGFNNIPVAERILQETIGRGVDLACMTAAAVMELHTSWISDFLDRVDGPSLFCAPADVLTASRTTAEMVAARPDKLFYFAASGDYPPIPDDPLHFPPINTLMCVLPVAALAQPRRIFLFGCDGAAPSAIQSGTDVYFRQGSDEYGKQQVRNAHYARWLERDTFFFNVMISVVLEALSTLHRAPLPQIYNCNPDSAYRHFPKITPREFISLHTAKRTPDGFFPARVGQLVRQLERLSPQAQRLRELEVQLGALRREMEVIRRVTAPLRALRRMFSR